MELKETPILDYDQIYPSRKSLVDKTGNQVNVIHPYRSKHGVWSFDDEEVGLRSEPFVGNINKMIDQFANGEKQVTVYISRDPISEATLSLTNVDEKIRRQNIKIDEDDNNFFYYGNYQLDGTEIVGWLCPATLKYFKNYPEKIYVKVEKYAN